MVFVRDGACGHVVIKGSRGGFVFLREGVVMERGKVGMSGKEAAVVAKWVNLYGNLGGGGGMEGLGGEVGRR